MTETTTQSVRQALRQIREELSGTDYLPHPRLYDCDRGILEVSHEPSSDGGRLLGCFRAKLLDRGTGEVLGTYRV